jgi:hypothetical protein
MLTHRYSPCYLLVCSADAHPRREPCGKRARPTAFSALSSIQSVA